MNEEQDSFPTWNWEAIKHAAGGETRLEADPNRTGKAIRLGRLTVLIGKNATGKTTLVRYISEWLLKNKLSLTSLPARRIRSMPDPGKHEWDEDKTMQSPVSHTAKKGNIEAFVSEVLGNRLFSIEKLPRLPGEEDMDGRRQSGTSETRTAHPVAYAVIITIGVILGAAVMPWVQHRVFENLNDQATAAGVKDLRLTCYKPFAFDSAAPGQIPIFEPASPLCSIAEQLSGFSPAATLSWIALIVMFLMFVPTAAVEFLSQQWLRRLLGKFSDFKGLAAVLALWLFVVFCVPFLVTQWAWELPPVQSRILRMEESLTGALRSELSSVPELKAGKDARLCMPLLKPAITWDLVSFHFSFRAAAPGQCGPVSSSLIDTREKVVFFRGLGKGMMILALVLFLLWLSRRFKIADHIERLLSNGEEYLDKLLREKEKEKDANYGLYQTHNVSKEVQWSGLSPGYQKTLHLAFHLFDQTNNTIGPRYLALEEPEAFLHPGAAEHLGRALARRLHDEKQLHLLIETHSEHLLTGLRDEVTKLSLRGSDFQVWTIDNDEKTYIKSAAPLADFQWPEGFLSKHYEDLLEARARLLDQFQHRAYNYLKPATIRRVAETIRQQFGPEAQNLDESVLAQTRLRHSMDLLQIISLKSSELSAWLRKTGIEDRPEKRGDGVLLSDFITEAFEFLERQFKKGAKYRPSRERLGMRSLQLEIDSDEWARNQVLPKSGKLNSLLFGIVLELVDNWMQHADLDPPVLCIEARAVWNAKHPKVDALALSIRNRPAATAAQRAGRGLTGISELLTALQKAGMASTTLTYGPGTNGEFSLQLLLSAAFFRDQRGLAQ